MKNTILLKFCHQNTLFTCKIPHLTQRPLLFVIFASLNAPYFAKWGHTLPFVFCMGVSPHHTLHLRRAKITQVTSFHKWQSSVRQKMESKESNLTMGYSRWNPYTPVEDIENTFQRGVWISYGLLQWGTSYEIHVYASVVPGLIVGAQKTWGPCHGDF